MVTYTWKIAQLDACAELDGRQNVVCAVHWRLEGRSAENICDVYGAVTLGAPSDSGPFTPYEDLTEAQVLGWVQDTIGEERVGALKATLASNLEQLLRPSVVAPALPWAE